jgi:transglutaminase-like putative cysteine protease
MMKSQGKPEQLNNRAEASSARWTFTSPVVSRLGDWRAWLDIFLLFVVMEIAVLSLEQARWLESSPPLTLVLILTMLAVWLLIKTRLPGFLVHIIAPVIGALITYGLLSGRLGAGGTAYFAVFLVYLVWLVGYISTWFFLCKKNAWVAVCLGALVVLVNLSNLPGSYYYFFGLYFIAAAFLIARGRLTGRSLSVERGIKPARKGIVLFAVSLLCLVVLAVAFAWVVPEVRVPELQTMIATQILWKQDIEKSRFNIFAAVPAKQALITSSMIQELPFEDTWHQGERIDFIVSSRQPSYWQVHAYDTYTSQGWTNRPASEYLLENEPSRREDSSGSAAERLTYKVVTRMKTNEMLITGTFVSADMPVMVRESGGEITSVMAPRLLGVGESYTVTVDIPKVTPADLAGAGQDYPPSISGAYLQLPADFPGSVKELSTEVTAEAGSPYQKVLAIRDYLSGIPYKTEVEPPPEGSDGVEYFLLTGKSGFCIHYASAMAVMLRSVGVPSRLAVGYLPGQPGEKASEYVLRDKQYHAWPQVYFPGYGWVDIEVTPSGYVAPGSEVILETPWVSGEAIAELPQWDIWRMMAMYGMPPGGVDTPSAAAAQTTRRGPAGPMAFADELGRALLITLVIIVGFVLLSMPLVLVRSAFHGWVWRVDRANLKVMAYEKLCRLGAMVKMGPRPSQTPLEYTAGLAAEFPSQTGDIEKITQAYLENRFGGRRERPSLFEEAEILKARCNVFDELLKRLGPVGRFLRGR